MSGINIDPTSKQRIQPRRYCRNGLVVPAQFQQDVAQSLNQVARFRPREYFRSTGDVTGPVESKLWRFAGHIGPMARAVIARILMAPATQGTQTNNPRVQMALTDTSGNLITSGTAFFGYRFGDTPVEKPEEWGVATIGLSVGHARDTSFRAQILASEEARPISCTVYEVPQHPDTDNGYVTQQYSVGAPILDVDRSSQQVLASSLYRRGSASLFAFSSDTDATAPTNAQGIIRGVVDNVAINAKQSQEAAGYEIDLRYCNRKTKTTVPVRIECFAGLTGSGAGSVLLMDSDLTVHASFVISGAASWQTLDIELPADLRLYHIAHAGDTLGTVTTYAVTAYHYID